MRAKKILRGFCLAMAMTVLSVLPCRAGGIPAGMILDSSSGLSVVTVNFDSNFTKKDANDYFALLQGLMAMLELQSDIQVFSPDALMQMGFDGDSLHELVLSMLGQLEDYTEVRVTMQRGGSKGDRIRFEIYDWGPASSSGMYFGALEVPVPFPDISYNTTYYLKFQVSEVQTIHGMISNQDIFYQNTCTGTATYLMSIELSQAVMQQVMTSFMGLLM